MSKSTEAEIIASINRLTRTIEAGMKMLDMHFIDLKGEIYELINAQQSLCDRITDMKNR